ncbi:MAG: PhzF family phenazine biosynthesis protein, partial [Candidatus Izimaplasma sp.]|nr:PhzF family phenazine biosynthesis protein [Candidatus Izimaplasma bacterium]
KIVGYSETAFVMSSETADYKVRFFTPTSEVDLCGHATIATFNLLKILDRVENGSYTQETKVGILNIHIKDNLVYMQQPNPIYSEIVSYEELKECFENVEFNKQFIPQVISTGLREIFLPVKDFSTLNDLIPRIDKIKEVSLAHNAIGIHAFCFDEEIDAYGRNFAPVVGIDEESATGTSNGALACYFFKHAYRQSYYVFRQGYSMNLPSEITAYIQFSNEIEEIWVGGSALLLDEENY